MGFKWCVLTALVLHAIGAVHIPCPTDSNCICRHNPGLELDCNVDGRRVEISLLPETYLIIKCINTSTLNFDKLPKCANPNNTFKSVTFKNCPLPSTAFKEVLENVGVSKTLALIFQNAKKLSGYFDRKHFTGLQNLTKLLISVKGLTQLPDDLFEDIDKLQWLNIRSNRLKLTQELFKPLGRLETLEISHNHLSNISSNLFSHMSLLKKLSLWQDNVTWFSKDMFTGADVLEELDLSSNGLEELPETIFKPLKRLKKLTLFSNKFSSLPRNLFQSNNQLETVIMLNNDVELRKLPESLFGNLPSMRQVYLKRCGLEDVPYDLFMNSSYITTISLAYNNIQVLPEAIFNDQIHLQELDLSSNQLENLSPKLFSSLVCLHTLNLSFNSLVTISGTTFAPLLSLRTFNIEHNNLQFITSYLFVNNRQRLSISMAYNKLDLENDQKGNSSWRLTRKSPFAMIKNLKLLNLSHNLFKHTFKDWWENGHDVLDISYNELKFLRDNELEPETYVFSKPIKEVRLSNNQLQCSCINNEIIDFLQNKLDTEIPDYTGFDCPFWTKGNCEARRNVMYGMVACSLLYVLYWIATCTKINQFVHNTVKKILLWVFLCKNSEKRNKTSNVVVEYTISDEEFVLKTFLPELKYYLDLKLDHNPVNSTRKDLCKKVACKQIFLTHHVKEMNATFVIFSPKYLISHYSHVGMKSMCGEMTKAKNTIYVFVDNGSENLIHAFVKQQRDHTTMIVWGEANPWNKVKDILGIAEHKDQKMSKLNKIVTATKRMLTRTIVNQVKQTKVSTKIYSLDSSTPPILKA